MRQKAPTFLAAISLLLSSTSMAFAQDATDSDDQAFEEVFVTGWLIPKLSGNSSSPVAVVDQDEIRSTGAGTIADIIQNLTMNTGAENYTDAFTQNISTGTSNINLRGLGVSSTLVLLNGKRQVVSGAPNDNGLLFVDTSSLVPLIAISRIEILLDGATATYGSDAVAGVVNFITRNNFEGLELSVGAQTVTEDSQLDVNVDGIFGFGNDTTHFMASFGYLHRTSLTTAERRFPGSLDPINGDFSNAGQPGSFVVPFLPTGLPQPIQDAWTATFDSAGNIPTVADALEPIFFPGSPVIPGAITPIVSDLGCSLGANSIVPATFPFGFCRLDFGSYFDLVAEEERVVVYANFSHDFSDTTTFNLEFSGARNRANRNNSPSFPIPAAQIFAASHPDSPYGPSPFPLFFIGRPIGEGPPAVSTHDSNTWRVQAGFEGTFGDQGTWQFDIIHGENDFYLTIADVLGDRFSAALNGLGGAGCLTLTPGMNGCQYFNPFSSALATPNDPTLISWFTGLLTQDYTSKLTVVDAIMTNSFEAGLSAPIGYAFGVQYRYNSYGLTWDAEANADNYLFLVGGPNFASTQEVFAVFGEVNVPVHERIDLQLALRYESYDMGVGDTLDPKIGIVARATDAFTFRASWGTSFRAPNIYQQLGTQTTLQQLIDSAPGQPTTPQFFPVRTTGVGNLVPETSKTLTFGFTWEPNDNFTLNFDYWRFNFENIIIQESAQAILDADPSDPRITRSPLTGGVIFIDTNFVNASSLKTRGFDVGMLYRVPLDTAGDLTFGVDATYIDKYDLVDPQAGAVSGAGVRNFKNFGRSTPQWRIVGSAGWVYHAHEVHIYVRFIDSYLDDQNNLPISSHTTVDFQYNFYIGDRGDDRAWRLSVGVINMFNKFPPTVLTNQGFDTKVHDPRGRMVYGRVTKGF